MGRMDGIVALVTGGARGQGAAAARQFVEEGARVVIGDVLEADGELTAKDLGDRALFVRLDVTDEADWSTAVSAATERFGAVNVLVNNAGVFRLTPLATATLDDYLKVIHVNQVGVFLGICAASRHMTEGGSIINVSSVAGLQGSAAAIAYTASKFAVRGMTKSAAIELAPVGIRVNSIHPGFVDTPMLDDAVAQAGPEMLDLIRTRIPMGRFGAADEVANLAVFLASPESAYVTGAEFVIDGGLTAVLGGA